MYIQDYFVKYYDYRPFGNRAFIDKIIGNFTKVLGYIANIILPIWFKCFPGKIDINKTIPITVITTTFPTRINYIWLVIECMLRQKIQPSKIKLYLSKKQFISVHSIPSNLKKYVSNKFLEIIWVDEDIKSHKKYWYVVNENPYQKFITIDDDIIYDSDTIKILWEKSIEENNCVISCYNHKIKKDEKGEILPYSHWRNEPVNINENSNNVFFGSGGGTLFPEGSLLDANQPFNIISQICPYADDIWLNAFIRKNGFTVINVKNNFSVPEWIIWNNIKLSTRNNGDNLNDIQLFQTIQFIKDKFNYIPFL